MKTISFQLVQQKPRMLAFLVCGAAETSGGASTCSRLSGSRRTHLTLLSELCVRIIRDEVDEVLQTEAAVTEAVRGFLGFELKPILRHKKQKHAGNH